MARKAVVSRIEIQWWGKSRSRKFHVDIDNQRIINYNNEKYPGFNGWNKYDNIFATGSSIQFVLSDGVKDCWGMNRKLGIRQLNIYGTYVDEVEENVEESKGISQTADLFAEAAKSIKAHGNYIRILPFI